VNNAGVSHGGSVIGKIEKLCPEDAERAK